MLRHEGNMWKKTRSRRGSASIMAMLFLILFSALAVGFYGASVMSVQVAKNDRDVVTAQLAAESTLQFIRHHLGKLSISDTSDATALFNALFSQLDARLHGTTNLNGKEITWSTEGSGNKVISVPGGAGAPAGGNWMSLGPAGYGRLTITLSGSNLIVKAAGKSVGSAPSVRAVQIKCKPVAQAWISGSAGLMTRGSVTLSNGAQVSGGDVFSNAPSGTTPLTMSGGTKIDQNFLYTANTVAPSITNGARVYGQIIPNAVASFPQVDVTGFSQFVPSTSAPQGPKVITATSSLSANQVFTNIRIKANANTSFGNSQQINGVVYIESPNKVTFGGGMRMSGIVVTDNNTTTPIANNTITIANGVRMDTLATLDPTAFPASENIATLKTFSGAIILAPNYLVTLAGGARGYDGAMIAGRFDISNGYRGTINGGLIALDPGPFTMMGGGQVTFTGGNTTIPGLTGGSSFQMDPASYLEVAP